MISDFNFVVFWWLIIFLLGSLSLPLIFKVFNQFWDKGYIFSKITSLILISYLVFISSTVKLLPFTNTSIFLIVCILLIANLIYLSNKKRLKEFLNILKNNYRHFLFEELLFFIVLITWAYIRGFAPDIEGLEKFMDWGFVNSILRTEYMPPQDMWFAGSSINYYYFGQLIFALLTKVSSIHSAITYNLAIATVCALTFVSGFSLSSNITHLLLKNKSKFKYLLLTGLVSALLLTFGGNLHAAYKIASINIKNEGTLNLDYQSISKAANSYWYPDATRFIGFDPDVKDKTIHEFPLYSFVVADLHGHMNDIPVVLLFMAFLLAVIRKKTKKILNLKLIIGSGLILSIAYMTNAWDFAVYGLLFAIFTFTIDLIDDNFTKAFSKTLVNGLGIIFTWYLFTLPFSLHFTPMTEGIKVSDGQSPFYQLFILHGGFWLIIAPFVFYFIYSVYKKSFIKKIKIKRADIFAFALVVTATLLVIIPEIIYVKDIYIYEHRRANTMFKLVYQAFIMYSVVAGYAFFRISNLLNKSFLRHIYKLVFLLVFISHLIYPYFAIKSFYSLKIYKGLWGLNFLQTQYPDNYQAINWINQNIKGQPIMLEAVGDSYTTFNQVSSATGLPTVQGWLVHEWLWRGGFDEPGKRQQKVQTIYESDKIDETKSLLHKYNVKYIFIGTKEREKYTNLNEKKFENMGAKVIFQSGKTKILEI